MPTAPPNTVWASCAIYARALSDRDCTGASKTLAERVAWELIEKHNPTWDLAVLNPPYIWGPPLHEVHSADKLNTSQKRLFDILTGAWPEEAYDAHTSGLGVVDVRDVALAHVRATQLPQASGTRALIGSFGGYAQEILDIGWSVGLELIRVLMLLEVMQGCRLRFWRCGHQ